MHTAEQSLLIRLCNSCAYESLYGCAMEMLHSTEEEMPSSGGFLQAMETEQKLLVGL